MFHKQYKYEKRKNILLIFFCTLFLCFLANDALSGGVNIHENSLKLNGYPPDSSFLINQNILMSYNADNYLYSSGGHGTLGAKKNKYMYFLFLIFREDYVLITEPVGKNYYGNYDEKEQLAKALKKLGYYKDKVNSDYYSSIDDDSLIKAIKKFQKKIGISNPDGIVDPFGPTIIELNKKLKTPNLKFFLQFSKSYKEIEYQRPTRFKTSFSAPKQAGIYKIVYNAHPIFTNFTLGIKYEEKIKLQYGDINRIKDFIKNNRYFSNLCTIEIVDPKATPVPEIALYLSINNKLPGVQIISPGLNKKPILFKWKLQQSIPIGELSTRGEIIFPDDARYKKIKDLKFRYMMYPDDDEWSDWIPTNEVYYNFINKGIHEFRVEGKYKDIKNLDYVTPQLTYSFTLSKSFISKPIIAKADCKKIDQKVPSSLYNNSRALLVGVNRFIDPNFNSLPYVEKDIEKLEEVLIDNKFEVIKLKGKITHKHIVESIEDVILASNTDDRLIIYFSSHGFQDKFSKSIGYISCFDCEKERPTNCINLNYLDFVVKRCRDKKIKHILIIVDSCFSGLGIILKNTKYPDIVKIATKQGAHMMTSGMYDQVSQIDHKLKMSTFTFYLIKGLSGAADYTNDEIITISELLVYVQYEVARETNSAQIPMLGKIFGQGEMVFDKR